jgi:predicted nucleic acid-binding protein
VKANLLLVDASVVMAVITDEPIRRSIVDRTRDTRAFAAASLAYEIGNGLSSNVRRGKLTAEQAAESLSIYQKMHFELVPVDLTASLECCCTFNIYAYVLTAARQVGVPLFTLDNRMRVVAGQMGVELVEWPV